MNSKSAFKLVAFLIFWGKVIVVFFPISMALVSLKQGKFAYGYEFFELNYKSAILFAVAFGIIFSVWNAMSFEELQGVELKQYLKAKQSYLFKNSQELSNSDLHKKLSKLTSDNRRWYKLSALQGSSISIKVKSRYGARDVVAFEQTNEGWIITSSPKFKLDFIDLGRNFKNITYVSKYLTNTSL
ncbi:MAG: hypothetical protein ACI8ZN_001803 [Bacteroidia bacterium]|jgi:hypothetical protein